MARHNKIAIMVAALLFAIMVIVIAVFIRFPSFGDILVPLGEQKTYPAQEFGIEPITSPLDANQNGVDDYTDLLLGARKDAENHPNYHSAYYAGGYPPEDEGVCTDVIWRAFQNAGYCLKDLVDADIAADPKSYPLQGKPDPNIDFRRVRNLKVFFDRNSTILTNDLSLIAEWQPGDIVIFSTTHIGVISDKRNKEGIPYLIHNAGQANREEDALQSWNRKKPITGHYRFDCSTDMQ